MFMKLASNATVTEFQKRILAWSDPETLQAIEKLYPPSLYPYATKDSTAQFWAFNRAWGDLVRSSRTNTTSGLASHHSTC